VEGPAGVDGRGLARRAVRLVVAKVSDWGVSISSFGFLSIPKVVSRLCFTELAHGSMPRGSRGPLRSPQGGTPCTPSGGYPAPGRRGFPPRPPAGTAGPRREGLM